MILVKNTSFLQPLLNSPPIIQTLPLLQSLKGVPCGPCRVHFALGPRVILCLFFAFSFPFFFFFTLTPVHWVLARHRWGPWPSPWTLWPSLLIIILLIMFSLPLGCLGKTPDSSFLPSALYQAPYRYSECYAFLNMMNIWGQGRGGLIRQGSAVLVGQLCRIMTLKFGTRVKNSVQWCNWAW